MGHRVGLVRRHRNEEGRPRRGSGKRPAASLAAMRHGAYNGNQESLVRGGEIMESLTVRQAAEKWGLSPRAVQQLCIQGRIPGAQKFGKANKIATSEDRTFSYIPDCSDLPVSPDADYVYICENNTIYGTKFKELPNTKGKVLVSDVSSCFLSEPVDVPRYGIIYGGVQKNIGPAGMVIAVIREDLITEDVLPGTPTMMTYKTHADAGSLYNTPNCWSIYICGKVFKWLKRMGGLAVMKEKNEEKAKLLYDYLDSSKLFRGTVVPKDRSLMNVPFVTGDKDLDAKFVKEAKAAGLENLKGHRTVGGMRASIYNAMPREGVEDVSVLLPESDRGGRPGKFWESVRKSRTAGRRAGGSGAQRIDA